MGEFRVESLISMSVVFLPQGPRVLKLLFNNSGKRDIVDQEFPLVFSILK